ncbi:MAG: ABC transporter permease, partial [Cytophagia bacterium]|nr:ABC transporter permease [Cytophagia bacterium]
MIFKHLKTSIRSLIKAKSYSLLNIVGLSTSLIVFLLITLYVSKEFSYDKYHEKADRIYRVYKEDIGNFYQGSNFFAVVPSPLAPTMAKDFPEVEAATRVRRAPNTLVKVGDQVYLEDNTYSADPSIFNIFSLSIIAGNASDPLSAYESVVLSRTLAEKYFGSVDKALGETIMYRDERPVQVSAVFEDMLLNSHFRLTLVVNFEGQMNHDDESLTNWNNSSYYAFVLLVPGADSAELQDKMPELRTKYADDPVDEDGQESIYYLQPLSDVHFTSGVNFDIAPNADRQSLYIYLGIAIMILVIAGVNYVNLATGRAMNKT